MPELDTKSLPESAYEPLKPGESYPPIVASNVKLPELTPRSVGWGIFLCIIFTIAAAYSGLKVGQVMESAIPISILAIGLARLYRRRSTLLENVIITGIGGVAGPVVAGAVFTIPALYILKLDPHPVQTIFICLAGGCLGVLFLIPLRRYFVRDMHGKLPYPEATAIAEVLVTGEKGGSQAKLLLQATAIAGVYDLFVTTFQVCKEFVDFRFIPVVRTLSDRARMAFSFDAIGFILGLGYVMGLRSSMILCAGGVLSNFVLVPLIWFIGSHLDSAVYPATAPDLDHDGGADLPKLRAIHRRRRHRDRGHLRNRQVVEDRGQFVPYRAARFLAEADHCGGTHRSRHLNDGHLSRSCDWCDRCGDAVGHSAGILERGWNWTGPDSGLFLLLYIGCGQCHRNHRPQPGFRNDDADHHHFLRRLAQVWSIQYQRHVLRDGDCGDGVYGVISIRPDDHRPQNRVLARLHSLCAGESEVPRRGCCSGRRGIHDRDAGAHIPVWRSAARRLASRAGVTAGVDHEGASGRLHEPPAHCVSCCSESAP